MKPHSCPFCKIELKDPLKHVGMCQVAHILMNPQFEKELQAIRHGDPVDILNRSMAQWSMFFERAKGRPPTKREFEAVKKVTQRNIDTIRGME